MAGLGGIFSERSGVVNIGLEGMMIMGTWFGAWAAWLYGPWWGVAAGIFGGLIFGLIHAIATVSFQVDHIVSGVAINILAAGTARFFSVVAYANESKEAQHSLLGFLARYHLSHYHFFQVGLFWAMKLLICYEILKI